jgi:ABC-type polysaccharide/polyol phosphate export permease
MNNRRVYYLESDAAVKNSLGIFLSRILHELVIYRYVIYNLVSANLRARYRRSVFGFLWSLLNPLFTMVIMGIVFSTIFNNRLENYSVYLFSGLLPWALILNSMINGTMTLVLAERYLKKVYVPKLIFPLVTVGVEVINFLLSLVSLFVVALFLGARISLALLTLPFALILTALFILGLVLIISIITVYFRDMSHIVQITFTGLFYLTPIVYPLELLASNPLLFMFIKLNPFLYFVQLFHEIIYRAGVPQASLWLICFCLTFVSLFAGLLVYHAKDKDVIYRL